MVTETIAPVVAPKAVPDGVPVMGPHHATAKDAEGSEPIRHVVSFYIYSAPVRLWHWATAILIFALALTGFFIASPPHSVDGDTSSLFVMGHLREWHFIAGWLFAIGMVWRTYFAIVGGKHARLIYFVPFWSLTWWKEVMSVVKYYLFLDRSTHKWVGHNPLARVSMWLMFTLGSAFMGLTGFAMYGEQQGMNSWEFKAFGWMFSLAGSSMAVRSWHHWGMYLLLLFIIIHVYFAVRDDIMGRVSTISSMVNGWRTFRDFKD